MSIHWRKVKLAVTNYPIQPEPIFEIDEKTGVKRWLRNRFDYPIQHGKCYWCGTSLKGKRKSYCSDEHYYNYRRSFVWSNLRKTILLRDGYRCVKCGLTQKRLEVDHIKAISLGGDFFDQNNLQTLCHRCHKHKTKEDLKKLSKTRKVNDKKKKKIKKK